MKAEELENSIYFNEKIILNMLAIMEDGVFHSLSS